MAKYIIDLEVSSPVSIKYTTLGNGPNDINKTVSIDYTNINTVSENSETGSLNIIEYAAKNLENHDNYFSNNMSIRQPVQYLFKFIQLVAIRYLLANIDFTKCALSSSNSTVIFDTDEFTFKMDNKSYIEYINKQIIVQDNIKGEETNLTVDQISDVINCAFDLAVLTNIDGQIYLSDINEDKVKLILEKTRNHERYIGWQDTRSNITIVSGVNNVIETPVSKDAQKTFIVPENYTKIGFSYYTNISKHKLGYIGNLTKIRDAVFREINILQYGSFVTKYSVFNTIYFNRTIITSYAKNLMHRFYSLHPIDFQEEDEVSFYIGEYLPHRDGGAGLNNSGEVLKAINEVLKKRISSPKNKFIILGITT